jgi:Flp pilus assembly protein TadG
MVGRRVGSLARSERGVALAEFALVAPLALLLLFGILDFGKAINYWIDETHLANAGARWAVVNRNPATSGTLQNYIKGQADTTQLKNGATVEISAWDADSSGTIGVGDPVQVCVKYTYNWLPFIRIKVFQSSITSTTLAGSATMRLEQAPSNYTPDHTTQTPC